MNRATRVKMSDNTYWRIFKYGKFWAFEDHTGYVRVGEQAWRDFVPLVHGVAANHGLTCNLS